MKNFTSIVASLATVFAFNVSFCQVQNAGFDDLSLDFNSYWIGTNNGSNDFISGFAHFSHLYDTAYYSWNGFAYSNVADTVTAGWINQYASRPGDGAENTENYGVYYQWGNDSIWFDKSTTLSGMYFTNSTLAALSMLEGDAYAKKFGGESGDDPDWFLLTIRGFDIEGIETGSIDSYLADYRFENNDEDYIVTDWRWVDFIILGEVKTLKFELSSTDNGDWGMNTPAYFCLDELKTADNTDVIVMDKNTIEFTVYPNPFSSVVSIKSELSNKIEIYNLAGMLVYNCTLDSQHEKINLSELDKGLYFINLTYSNHKITKKIVMQ